LRSTIRQCGFIAPILALAAFAGIGPLAPQPSAAQTFTPRIGNCTINDAVHRHIEVLRDELEKQSNGRIKGELFINCQLGNIARQVEGVQLGTQDFFTIPPGNLVGVDPRYSVTDVPGMFQNFEHAHASINHPGFYDKYAQVGRDKGLYTVSLWQSGQTAYLTLKPLRTIEEFRGLKFRVLATKFETELMSRYGATGVPIPFPEIVPSLMSKMIDGARTAPLVMASAKMYTAAKYATMTGDTFIPIITFASNQWMQKLPADLRELVLKVSSQVKERGLQMAIADQEAAMKSLAENGVELIRLSPEQQAEWMRRARQASDDYFGNEPTMKDMYAALKDAAEKTRK
jgi:TRAP-type C4-dicarboxylate transport system substrate-binding protein